MGALFERLGPVTGFTDHEQQLLDAVERICRDVIGPNAARVDHEAAFPWENVEAINELGLNQIFLPPEAGGHQLSYATYLESAGSPTGARRPGSSGRRTSTP